MRPILPLLGLLLAGLFGPLIAADRPPNIIFVLADDLGWTDLACFGSKYYETPNIDRLAAQGMRLTNHHHCQNCAPTRSALLSGQYGARTGTYTVGSIERFNWQTRPLRPVDNVTKLSLERDTFANQLKAAGYATAMFGKWHLGSTPDYHPSKRGFDEAIESEGKHFDFETKPKTEYPKGQYLADFLTDKAVDFIQRNQAKPFLLYLPHFGVHSPFQAKSELVAKFKGKPGVGGHNSPTYAAMLASVDESVGRVMAKLEELKLADNTVIIFASDNGGVGGYDRPDGLIREPGTEGKDKKAKAADDEDGGGITDNTPLRSGKGSLYEGGSAYPSSSVGPARSPRAPRSARLRRTSISSRHSSNSPVPPSRARSSTAKASCRYCSASRRHSSVTRSSSTSPVTLAPAPASGGRRRSASSRWAIGS